MATCKQRWNWAVMALLLSFMLQTPPRVKAQDASGDAQPPQETSKAAIRILQAVLPG